MRWTVPLELDPAAVGVGAGSVWVADGVRGLAVRLDPDDGRVAARARWRRGRGRRDRAHRRRGDGQPGLGGIRLPDARPRRRARARRGASACPTPPTAWSRGPAPSGPSAPRTAVVMRLDVRTGRTTDVIRLAGHAGARTAATDRRCGLRVVGVGPERQHRDAQPHRRGHACGDLDHGPAARRARRATSRRRKAWCGSRAWTGRSSA